MKVTFIVRSDNQGKRWLEPHDKDALKAIKRHPDYGLVLFDWKQHRNPRFHKKAFAMLHRMHEMSSDSQKAFEPWRRMMIVKAGFFTSIGKVDLAGTVSQAVIPDSMDFASMEEDDFQNCIAAIHHEYVEKYGEIMTLDQLHEWASMY